MEDDLLSSGDVLRNLFFNGKFTNCVWNKLYNKKLWKDLRFPEGHVYEDMMTMYKVVERCSCIKTISDTLYYYRKRKGSITDTNIRKNIEDRLLAIDCMEEYAMSHFPGPFSASDVLGYRNKNARVITIMFAELLYQKHLPYEAMICKEATVKHWNSLKNEKKNLKSGTLFFLFMHAPFLIIPIRRLWMLAKRLVCTK